MAEGDASRWDAKYRARPLPEPSVSEAFRSVQTWIPRSGRAVDLAGGEGAHALWLAQQGLDVTLCDVSEVALARAQGMAEATDVSLRTIRVDLETSPVPPGPWHLALCMNYLQPSLWPAVAAQLEVGGRALWLHPTVENLTRHAKPSRRFLLHAGQGAALFEAAGLEVLFADESWVGGRHLCRVVGTVSRSGRR